MKLPLTYLLSSLFILSPIVDAEGKYYPDADWEKSSPESQGIELKKIKKIMDLSFSDSSTQGVVVIKNGIIIGEKYAEGYTLNSHGTSWSMAKSYYAALVGISIQRGEIGSLDDPASKYLEYYKDERSKITIRDLLNMSSGLDFPSHEHEKMFFQKSHLDYAKNVGVEKEAGLKFEYNNVNSMIIGYILYVVTVNLAFNYSSKIEIIESFKKSIKQKKKITVDFIKNNLYTKNIPDPELLIRTGGQNRLSDFMLWQMSYTEIFFLKKLWPDFNKNDFKKILQEYKKIKRNFGGING